MKVAEIESNTLIRDGRTKGQGGDRKRLSAPGLGRAGAKGALLGLPAAFPPWAAHREGRAQRREGARHEKSKTPNTPPRKQAQHMGTGFTEGDVQMANKPRKRCSTLSAIREIKARRGITAAISMA